MPLSIVVRFKGSGAGVSLPICPPMGGQKTVKGAGGLPPNERWGLRVL